MMKKHREKSKKVKNKIVRKGNGKKVKFSHARSTGFVKENVERDLEKIDVGEELSKGENKEGEKKVEKKKVKKWGFKLPKFSKKQVIFALVLGFVVGVLIFIYYKSVINFVVGFFSAIVLSFVYLIIRSSLLKAAMMKKMEDSFPDFIGLMASNLRAGMTIDKALLLSARKEFAPLDKEIIILGKDIVTGKEITQALSDAAKRIKSDKINKTIKLIISGIRSGGNLAVLLEETAENMRERNFVEKRAASNVLMYVIFIFFAVAFGSPILFGLSSVLVQILSDLVSSLPSEQVVTSVPFALTSVSVSIDFVFYFSLVFLAVASVLASLVLGLVSKGKEREGLKYILPLIGISVSLFLITRLLLLRYFSGLFG